MVKKSRRRAAAPARKAITASRQSATAPSAATVITSSRQPATAPRAATVGISTTPRTPLRTPLERLVDELSEAVAALQAELAALRQRYGSHTHDYSQPMVGANGHHWVQMRFLNNYIDGEYPQFGNWGFWIHGASTPAQPPHHETGGPN
jgi:hypothetical protein